MSFKPLEAEYRYNRFSNITNEVFSASSRLFRCCVFTSGSAADVHTTPPRLLAELCEGPGALNNLETATVSSRTLVPRIIRGSKTGLSEMSPRAFMSCMH